MPSFHSTVKLWKQIRRIEEVIALGHHNTERVTGPITMSFINSLNVLKCSLLFLFPSLSNKSAYCADHAINNHIVTRLQQTFPDHHGQKILKRLLRDKHCYSCTPLGTHGYVTWFRLENFLFCTEQGNHVSYNSVHCSHRGFISAENRA